MDNVIIQSLFQTNFIPDKFLFQTNFNFLNDLEENTYWSEIFTALMVYQGQHHIPCNFRVVQFSQKSTVFAILISRIYNNKYRILYVCLFSDLIFAFSSVEQLQNLQK